MSSRPATPKLGGPRRFEVIYTSSEPAEHYAPGGYHPVNIDDTFREGAYTVIRKLGKGSFSTVWLAVDNRRKNTITPRYVALKVTTGPDPTVPDIEPRILDHLANHAPGDRHSQHVSVPLDTFYHQGPNGLHFCLVFDVMGASAELLARKLPSASKNKAGDDRYPMWIVKKLLLHTLRGLAFLHANGVVHADLQPGNILFSAKDLSGVPVDELRQIDHALKVQRKDGKQDLWAPENLWITQSLHEYVELDPTRLVIQLSDLGSAFFEHDPPSRPVTPRALRAPELILGQPPYGPGIDIWSFGCLVYEFVTGEPLFMCPLFFPGEEARNEADDDQLLQICDILQLELEPINGAWPRDLKTAMRQHCEDETYPELLEKFRRMKPAEIVDEEEGRVCGLIKRMLVFEPHKRPTAKELLEDPWFKE